MYLRVKKDGKRELRKTTNTATEKDKFKLAVGVVEERP